MIQGAENVTVTRCTNLNPATLLLSPSCEEVVDEADHDCLDVTELCTKPRPDIKDTPLSESDCVMFVDGSCLRDEKGTLCASYAVCTVAMVLEASCLKGISSAQISELVALTRACIIGKNLRITIFTDSQYGFGVVHDLDNCGCNMDF